MLPQQKNKISDPSETTPLSIWFNTLFKKYYHVIEQELAHIGIERYFFVLTLICRHEQITQQCIADYIGIDKASMVRIIDYLTKKGLVKRTTHQEDRRSYIISATKKGLQLCPIIEQAFEHVNNCSLKGFTATEKKQFLSMMTRIETNLSATLNQLPNE